MWSLRIGLPALILVLWQVSADHWIDSTFTTKPTDIVRRLGEWSGDGTLWTNTWITVQEIVYGFLIGAAAGALAGFVPASLNLLYRVLDPFVMGAVLDPEGRARAAVHRVVRHRYAHEGTAGRGDRVLPGVPQHRGRGA
ncbi:hypothetical protein [Amycolatopsis pithecellobii]|uniref:hypothetical protein n=1 Tax=Amycolatopsis pithecellobii TaxID=664692 RepID=UPI001FE5D83B|nr:hypothetical protein [Amycolatopsis pithecellobii]